MYTQCNHCKAIFRVTMKELTAAQGLLRCGECDAIFDAMKSLSTTLPEERRFAQAHDVPDYSSIKKPESTHISFFKKIFSTKPATTAAKTTSSAARSRKLRQKPNQQIAGSRPFLIIGTITLVLLLVLQALYFSRNWLALQPQTAALTRDICDQLGCEIAIPRDLTQLKLLSRNVYSHPNTPNVLTISLSIQNDGHFDQPYPLIEISFLNKNNKIVALRRFTPEEYVKDFNHQLMPVGVPRELVLNIADPGTEAVRFQFRFL